MARLPEVQSIGVYSTGVTDAGLKSLSESNSIRAVYAGRIRISEDGLAAIAQLPDLRALNVISNTSITDAGVAHFRNSPNLEHLEVSDSKLTDAGLERLVVDCPKLRRLTLDHTAVTSQGLRLIGALSQLEQLRCYGTTIDDSVVKHFRSLGRASSILCSSASRAEQEAWTRPLRPHFPSRRHRDPARRMAASGV